MKTGSILASQLNKFAQITNQPTRIAPFSNMVSTMWQTDESKPDWCFIIEDGDKAVGRIGFMRANGRSDTVAIFGWTLPWNDDYLVAGKQLLEQCLTQLRQQGIVQIERELVSAWGTVQQQKEVLEAAQFILFQEQCFYEYAATLGKVPTPPRLQYKPLSAVGEAAFINAVQQATVGTFDRTMQRHIQEMGLPAFVQQDYELIRDEHEHEPHWWQLAYTLAGELVGFVQPVRFPNSNEGNIAYLGVVPA